MLAIVAVISITPAFSRPADLNSDAALLDGYRHVEVASVSDAMEKVTGQRMYLSHRMQPIFTSKFAGFALTVKLKKKKTKTRMPWTECSPPSIRGRPIRCT